MPGTDADDGLSGVEIEFSMDEPVGNSGQDDNNTATETSQRRTQPVAAITERGGAIRGTPCMEVLKRGTLLKPGCSVTRDDHASVWAQKRGYRSAITG